MDSLDRIRAGHKKLRENPVLHPVTDEASALGKHDRTLAQILQDPKEQYDFINRFLFKEDSVRSREIAEALADGHTLTEEQDTWLELERIKYNQRRLESEQVREFLTKEDVQRLGELDPRIGRIIGKIGPEKTGEMLGKEFETLAIADDGAFERMRDALRGLRESRTGAVRESVEKDFIEQLARYRIAEPDYIKATESGPTPQTMQKLGELAEKQYGIFRKTIDAVSGGALSFRAGRKLFMTYKEQIKLMDECDAHMKAIGDVLAGTLNADMRQAIQRAMLEGGPIEEKKEKENVTTIAEYREAKSACDPVALRKEYQAYMDAEAKKRGVKDWAKQQPLHDELTDAFVDRTYDKVSKYKKTRGIFAILVSFLFNSKDDIKNILK